MLSAILPATRRALRSVKKSRKSRRRANLAPRFERLEDRNLLSAGAFFSGLGFFPNEPPGGTALGVLGSNATGASADGTTVIGNSPVGDTVEAFRWNLGDPTITPLGFLPGATSSGANGISFDGSVIVGSSTTETTFSFRWVDGTMEEIPDLPGDVSNASRRGAYDVSDDGTVVVGTTPSTLGSEAYLWTQGVGTMGLGDLPGGRFSSVAVAVTSDGSTVVGWGVNADDTREAYRWTEETGMVGLGSSGFISRAHDVSADGSMVVGWDRLEKPFTIGNGRKRETIINDEAVRWTIDEFGQVTRELLGVLPGGNHWSQGKTISGDGSVIVGTSVSSIGAEVFLWDAINGMRSLQDVLVTEFGLDLTG